MLKKIKLMLNVDIDNYNKIQNIRIYTYNYFISLNICWNKNISFYEK